jgi:hypothetical protein
MKITGNKAPKKAVGSKTEGDVGYFGSKDKKPSWALVPNKTVVLIYLLWYLNNSSRCKIHSAHSNMATEVHKVLQEYGLVTLKFSDSDDVDEDEWAITEKGCAIVRHMMDLPLPEPVTTWSMPEKGS